jgi:hypothetical protein
MNMLPMLCKSKIGWLLFDSNLINFFLISKQFLKCYNNDYFWERKYQFDFRMDVIKPKSMTWKQIYQYHKSLKTVPIYKITYNELLENKLVCDNWDWDKCMPNRFKEYCIDCKDFLLVRSTIVVIIDNDDDDTLLIYDGNDFIVMDDDIPDEFKSITEFPLRYWVKYFYDYAMNMDGECINLDMNKLKDSICVENVTCGKDRRSNNIYILKIFYNNKTYHIIDTCNQRSISEFIDRTLAGKGGYNISDSGENEYVFGHLGINTENIICTTEYLVYTRYKIVDNI